MRVVSTLPGATDVLRAIGLDPVGVSHRCRRRHGSDAPGVVTRSPLEGETDTGAIDDRVGAEGDPAPVAVDADRLAALEPDLVVAQGTCDVCAVTPAAVDRALDATAGDPTVLRVDPHRLEGVYRMIDRIGAATDRPAAAAALVDGMRSALAALDADAPTAEPPSVAVLDWTDPMMTAGHWVPELVAAAGGRYVPEGHPRASTPRRWSTLRALDPEVLLVAPCGLDLEGAATNADDLVSRPGWDGLRAVRDDAVWLLDGRRLVNRPGPAVVETARAVAGILHGPGAGSTRRTDLLDRALAAAGD